MIVRRWLHLMVLGTLLASVWPVAPNIAAQEVEPLYFQPKQLNGPADELGEMRLPDPQQAGTKSPYMMSNVQFSGGVWSGELNIEHTGKLALLLVTRDSIAWNVQLTLPSGQQTSFAALSAQSGGTRTVTSLGLEGVEYPAERYTIYNPEPGLWQVTIQTTQSAADGFIFVTPESTYALYSYFNTINLIAGQPVSLGAYLYNEPPPTETLAPEKTEAEVQPPSTVQTAPKPLTSIKVAGEVILYDPKGQQTIFAFKDDGKQLDGIANDGKLGTILAAGGPGMYQAQVRVRGTLEDGSVIERTSEHEFPLLPASLSLTGLGTSRVIDDYRIVLGVEAAVHTTLPADAVLYAEVWGRDAFGSSVPAGWASTTVPLYGEPGTSVWMEMEFDTRWMAWGAVYGPFELRDVRVQDPDTLVPLTTAGYIPLGDIQLAKAASLSRESIDPNNPEMRMGRRVKRERPSSAARADSFGNDWLTHLGLASSRGTTHGAQPVAVPQARSTGASGSRGAGVSAPLSQARAEGILLVHGYCSGRLWPEGEFDDGWTVEFNDVNQNRSHDQFARRIAEQGDAAYSNSFSVVAHSQGGAAALHLYSRYWSGLDFTQAPRRIQSVGTPYLGTPLAGVLAWVGKIFGASCGANWSLTPLGSSLWMVTIPRWAKQQVYYSTTAHGNWWIFESICHASSAILAGPDDGVVSNIQAQLPGGNNLGMKRDWCHSSNMIYPAQYGDTARNNEMDIYGRVTTDVGVISGTGTCPNGQGVLTIHMDDEDNNNANSRSGWIGAITSTSNTTFRFCRVRGTQFRALSSTNVIQNHYAVLKLGSFCPNGSVEFTRHFDNEDNNNKNSYSGSIAPNVSNSNTTLSFCLFRWSALTMGAFPDFGTQYGVFAASDFSQRIQTGSLHTDDEDRNNKNGYWADVSFSGDAQRIISTGSNTDLKLVRVR